MPSLLTLSSMRFGVLPGGQIENRSAVVLNGFVAEPPIQLLTVHERFDLVLGVGVEETAANTTGQNSENLVLVAQISHHSESCRDSHAKGFTEGVNPTVKSLAGAGCRVRTAAYQSLSKTLSPDRAHEFHLVDFSPEPLLRILSKR